MGRPWPSGRPAAHQGGIFHRIGDAHEIADGEMIRSQLSVHLGLIPVDAHRLERVVAAPWGHPPWPSGDNHRNDHPQSLGHPPAMGTPTVAGMGTPTDNRDTHRGEAMGTTVGVRRRDHGDTHRGTTVAIRTPRRPSRRYLPPHWRCARNRRRRDDPVATWCPPRPDPS